MNKKIAFPIISATLLLLSTYSFAQSQKIFLDEAILMAKKNSPDYEATVNRYRAGYWGYKNYKARFLPQLRLNAIMPNYTNDINVVTQPDGTNEFRKVNQFSTNLRLNVNQNVGFTGGTFSVSTSINRLGVFEPTESTSYSLIPVSINYNQNSLLYNKFKWDRKIEPLLYEESQREFIEKMEGISLKTCSQYFRLLKTQIQAKIAQNNYANLDTLYKIAQGRFASGKIAENDLLKMELNYLVSKNNVTKNSIALKKASQDLARFLDLKTETLELEIPDPLEMFEVSLDKALSEAAANRKSVIEFRRRRLQAEKEVARVKGTNRLNLNVRANLGLSSSTDNEIEDLFNDYSRQQGVTLSLGIPIFDWGVSKSERRIAEANLDLTNTNIEQDQRNFEQEIELHVMNWSNQRDLLAVSEKAKEIAVKSYEISKNRYIQGKISITDLNISQQEKDQAIVTYLNALSGFWADYYTLRKLTLYDFKEDKKIKTEDIIFE